MKTFQVPEVRYDLAEGTSLFSDDTHLDRESYLALIEVTIRWIERNDPVKFQALMERINSGITRVDHTGGHQIDHGSVVEESAIDRQCRKLFQSSVVSMWELGIESSVVHQPFPLTRKIPKQSGIQRIEQSNPFFSLLDNVIDDISNGGW